MNAPNEAASPPIPVSKPRLIQLDVLRGFAILLVLGSHMPLAPSEAGRLQEVAMVWDRFGWTGVDLFFVLSGFLIGGLLFKELHSQPQLNARRFLIRRCFKIWPSYYLCVLLATLLVLAREHGHLWPALEVIYPTYLNVQNYVWGDRPIRHTWSLAVEEHFYLALPAFLILATLKRRDHNQELPLVPLVAVGVMLTCLAVRCTVNLHRPFSPYSHVFYTHIRADSLFFGVLLAYYYHFHPKQLQTLMQHRLLLAVLGALCIAPMLVLSRETSPFVWTVGYSLLYFGYGTVLLLLLYAPDSPSSYAVLHEARMTKAVAGIGFSSYTIYLWHDMFAARPVQWLFAKHTQGEPTVRWLCATSLYLLLAISTGIVMGRLVDVPALRLRDKWFPSHMSAVLQAND